MTNNNAMIRPIVFSAAQPTGQLTLGNYLGALRQWKLLQTDHDCLFCVVDLHALTVRQDPDLFRERVLDLAALYLACGIDPSKSVVFIQSHVSAHAELAWLLSTFTMIGELDRMTQFKEKSHKHVTNINAGLFTYPVLMAADILLYGAQKIPVGEDQKQHLELARDVAMRFNGIHGPVLVMPEPLVTGGGASRIKDLQDPLKKMSKSAESDLAKVMILDEPDAIMKKFKKAVTDSHAVVRDDEVNQPGVVNLLNIWRSAKGCSMAEALVHFGHNQYGKLKVETAEAVIEMLEPVRTRFKELRSDPVELEGILTKGADLAKERAEITMQRVLTVLGMPLSQSRFARTKKPSHD